MVIYSLYMLLEFFRTLIMAIKVTNSAYCDEMMRTFYLNNLQIFCSCTPCIKSYMHKELFQAPHPRHEANINVAFHHFHLIGTKPKCYDKV